MTPTGAGPAPRPLVHPDRVGAGPALVAALAAASAVALGVAGRLASSRGPLGPTVGLLSGCLVGLLAILGLRSLSVRLVSRLVALVSAGLLIRLAVLGQDPAGNVLALSAWLLSVVAIVVLGHLVPEEGRRDLAAGPGGGARPSLRTAGRRIALIWIAVVVVIVAVLPLVAGRLGDGAAAGDAARPADRGSDPAGLVATDRLDMTTRPRVSDRLVMTVRAAETTFWRRETFDRWDGRYWTRTDDTLVPLGPGGTVDAPPEDLAAGGPDRISQTFHLRTPFAQSLPAAPSAVRVEAPGPIAQREDGSLVAAPPLGSGATYTVESRRIPLSEEVLRAADGPVPPEVAARYAEAPVTTARVRAAASGAVAGASTTYDRVLALQEWMGDRAEYSLDAPLAPPGVDVVDHFLFESRRGWCEQIASSLVVMARVNGIPARLATGFVPDERSPLTGEFQVRERDAHAWAEVWFPDLGWVPFDPTAQVPLAGDDEVTSWTGWLADHGLAVVGGLVALAVVGTAAVALARRLRGRRLTPPPTWAGSVERRLDDLGVGVGRPREPWETSSAHSRALGSRLQATEVAEVGRMVDVGLYAPVPPSEAERARAERVLDRAEGSLANPPGRRSGADGVA